jgi:hypothetical protein
MQMFTPGAYAGYSWNKLVKATLFNAYHIRYDESKKYMEDTLLFYRLFKHSKKVIYAAVPYYNYVINVESVTNQWGLTESSETALSVLDTIITIEPNKKIKRKVIHELVIFERKLCGDYIKMKNLNDRYYFLRKSIKDRLPFILMDLSFPVKERLLSCLVLYPRLFDAVFALYKKLVVPP